MVMLAFNIEDELDEKFEEKLSLTGQTKSFVLRRAVLEFVDGDVDERKVQDSRD